MHVLLNSISVQSMKELPKEPDFPGQHCPGTLADAAFSAPLEDFWPKPFACQLQYSVSKILAE